MKTEPITPAQAREALSRFEDGFWGRGHPRISIPADPERDDDILLAEFINQAEMRATNDWQPIATAPRDGTWFIAGRRDLELPAIVCWPPSLSVGSWHWMGKHWGGAVSSKDFTHWRPLPPPPTS